MLVIEDEAVIAWMVEDILESEGFTTIAVAASASEAIGMAGERPPGLILSDINLGWDSPDGVAVVAQIVAVKPVPVVFVTGHAGPDAVARIEQVIGKARILRKPVARDELRRALVEIAEENSFN